jgi:hypothetical protein
VKKYIHMDNFNAPPRNRKRDVVPNWTGLSLRLTAGWRQIKESAKSSAIPIDI